jgi:hypothetical protein
MSKSITQKCKIENCDGKLMLDKSGKRYPTKGYCQSHYYRLIKYGNAEYQYARIMDGRSLNALYHTYCFILSRCHNKKDKCYKLYGGRGITVCDRWLDKKDGFWNFVKDMGDRPSPKHSVDRIDNNKGYSPDNCRWATYHQQNANKNNNNKTVGVSYRKAQKRYVARLMVNKVEVLNKTFKTYEEAIICRKEAEEYLIEGMV